MTNQHPITPPPELRRQWLDNDDFPFVAGTNDLLSIAKDRLNSVMDQAAQWGADQELRACCDTLQRHAHWDLAVFELMDDRRPKPPSLRKQAYDALDTYIYGEPDPKDKERTYNTIRRALEALPND